MNLTVNLLHADITRSVAAALAEDIGSGDITAQLIPAHHTNRATVITREACILAGQAWFNEVFNQLGGLSHIEWHAQEGQLLSANSPIVTLQGNSRCLLTGERTALNFVQLLSGVATTSHHYAQQVAHTGVKLLDTRKTLPGLRTAQKYAVTLGGCHNHRIGLFDQFLIKENHIAASGGIAQAIAAARHLAPGKPVEIEVENLTELDQALAAQADIIMLDNFSLPALRQAVQHTAGRALLEASGNITAHSLVPTAETGVNYISIGGLTKHVQAVDLSLRVEA